MRTLLTRSIVTLLALAALYLIPVNLALNLPATRAYLNRIAPDRFSIEWTRAWSWYPLRVELSGLAADGQTATEQWQVDAARTSASVSLLPLLRDGLIRVHDLDLVDLDLRLRPRPQQAADAKDPLRAFFPLIRNRDPAAVAEPAPATGGALRLEIDDLQVNGRHAFWVSHLRGTLPGELSGSFMLDTVAGQIGLASGAIDLRLESLAIGDDTEVSTDAAIQGRIEIPPFAIAEAKGIMALAIPWIDAQVDLPVQNLDFLPLLVGGSEGLKLRGQGRLRGRVVYAFGELLAGTDLRVDAPELGMQLGPYGFTGNGQVQMLQDPADQTQADLKVRFNEVQAHLPPTGPAAAPGKTPGQDPPLFVGRGLEAWLHARTPSSGIDSSTDPRVRPKRDLKPKPKTATGLPAGQEMRLTLTIPEMTVPDIAVHNRLLPPKWQLALLGGTGVLGGKVELAPDAMTIALDLGSDNADLRYRDYRATTDLLLQLRAAIKGGVAHNQVGLDLTGTTLRLDDARVAALASAATAVPKEPPPAALPAWQARLTVDRGALRVPAKATATDPSPIRAVARALADQGFGALLSQADGRVATTLTVSHLDWIADLMNRPMGLGLTGTAEIDADIRLADGWPTTGTKLTIPPTRLGLALLEHRVEGQGQASLTLEHGGRHPRLRLEVGLTDAQLRRHDEARPGIGEARLDAAVVVTDPLGKQGGVAEATLKLHSARVHDMAVYNAYLPANAPLALVGGGASLAGDLRLGPKRTEGAFVLVADGVRLAVDRTELSGDLRVDVLVRDGSARDMRFDITGSKLALNQVRVKGPVAATAAPDWHLRLQLEDTEVRWHKPMQLKTTAGVSVKDTRPFVALLDNERSRHPWIDDLLTVEDLGGHLRLTIDGKDAVLQDAMVSSAEIGVHAKGRAAPSGREAMVLVRWHNLVGALELRGAHKRFDLGNARASFDAYRPGATPLPALAAAARQAPTGGDRTVAVPEHRVSRYRHQAHPSRTPQAQESPFLEWDP